MSPDPMTPTESTAVHAAAAPRLVSGMSELAGDYDGFILDLWGVIHDGVRAYPAAVDCLVRLKRAGKHTVLLSNAPRRAAAIESAMAGMGIDRAIYDHVYSSGEEVHEHLLSRSDPWYAALGRACYHIGPERDRSVREGLGLDVVESVEEAEFVLNTGPGDDDETVADYEDVLEAAARRSLPMICANPDTEVIRGGRRIVCAGALALRYEELGGEVRSHGKPHAPSYRRCFELLRVGDRRRVLAVGDSLRTDIAGADAAGIDSALVTGGLHAEELGLAPGSPPDPDRLARACAAAGHVPVAAMAAFAW
jgi:HAD superfamily hydrolase (TIGR01459 family)